LSRNTSAFRRHVSVALRVNFNVRSEWLSIELVHQIPEFVLPLGDVCRDLAIATLSGLVAISVGGERRFANKLRRRDRQEFGFDPAMEIGNVLENSLLSLINDAHGGEQRNALLRLLPLSELSLFHWQACSLGLRPASLVDDLGQHQNPDVDRSLVVAQMLLDAINVQPRDLVDGLIEVDDARCAIDVLQLNRQRAAFIRLEGNSERLFESWEVRQV